MTAGSSPRTTRRPCVGLSMPAMRCSSVLLPEPDGPMRATNSPRRTVRSTLSSATTLTWPRSNSLVRLVACTTVSLTDSPLAFGISHCYFCAILQRFRRADDQIFAADETFLDLDFAPSGIFDNGHGSLDGFAIFHNKDGPIADGAGRDANIWTLDGGGRAGALSCRNFA